MKKPGSTKPDFSLEDAALAGGARFVAGVDEAGRGPLAGPVVAAAVILNETDIPEGLDDSKKLTALQRDDLFETIRSSAKTGIGVADVERIDAMNILGATMWAMEQAIAGLDPRPCVALVDGNRAPKPHCPCQTVVRGDGTSLSIAAASIIAKVTRDRLMCQLDLQFPEYGFARHKGYGTAAHLAALDRHGACPQHRRSFSPVRSCIDRRTRA